MTPLETVNAFLVAAVARDYDTALPLLAEDVEYQNMMLPPVRGRDAVRETAEGLLVLGTVLGVGRPPRGRAGRPRHERAHRPLPHGRHLTDLPVAGVFVVEDGRIALWRDYFDLQTVMTAMTAAAEV